MMAKNVYSLFGTMEVMHMDAEIDELLHFIQEHLDEPLSLEKLAREAAYSPYHFTRIFKQKTGLTPHQYVSSLKLQKAKDLLIHTDLTIRDISMEIGQQSLGTFTSRFTEQVGMSPSQFRKSRSLTSEYLYSLKDFRNWSEESILIGNNVRNVEGTIEAIIPFQGVIFIGLFPKPIPAGLPVYGTLLSTLGPFTFTNVKPGIYYLLATAVPWGMKVNDILLPHKTLKARAFHPVVVDQNSAIPRQHLKLREPRIDDPPVLISLPLLMKHFLAKQHSKI